MFEVALVIAGDTIEGSYPGHPSCRQGETSRGMWPSLPSQPTLSSRRYTVGSHRKDKSTANYVGRGDVDDRSQKGEADPGMSDAPRLDGPRPLTWLEAFPWLRAVSADCPEPWWESAIDNVAEQERREIFGRISEAAMGHLSHWTIGQLFPGLQPELLLTTLGLPGRPANTLKRNGCYMAADLSNLTIEDIVDWKNVGIGTVDAILRALADASTSPPTPPFVNATPTLTPSHFDVSLSKHWLPDKAVAVVNDLLTLATWQTAIGLPCMPLLEGHLTAAIPDEVLQARQRLAELSAEDVLDAHELEIDVARLLDAALATLEPRAAQILRQRLFADEPRTLDDLGQEFDVTRERIRQIEYRARAAMLNAITEGQLGLVARAARSLIGTVRPLSDLLELIPALGSVVPSVGQPAWRVLDRLDAAYEIEAGWCAVPTVSAALDWTASQLSDRVDRYGVVRVEELDLLDTVPQNNRDELTKQWLEACGYIIDGANVLTRTQSVGDYAAAVLSMHGEPMSSQEILDRFAFERSVGSLKNAMSIDDRFERVDRDRWALHEWGVEAYAGIRSVIRKELAKAGGTIPLDTLVEHITSKYSVMANSVIAYASAPPFELQKGVVRPAGSSREARKPPERTARLYRRGESWIYRVRVNHEHLRGTGSVAPVAVTTILGMEYGDRVELASKLGGQSLYWTGAQPAFGTIRRFLLEYDVPAGTDVFLVIGDDRTFDIEVVAEPSGDALPDALALIGAPRDLGSQSALKALAAAICLPDDSPVVSIIGAYRDRGDGDIADLLIAVRHRLEEGSTNRAVRSADVDDIMALL